MLSVIFEAKKGKRIAQTTLMNLLWDKVYFFVFSKVKNPTDAEDITIKTFTKVFRKLKLYNEDFEIFTWVKAIAYNTTIDHLRQHPNLNISLDRELDYLTIETPQPSPEQDLINKQNSSELEKAIANLPEIYREVIKLRFIEDKTYAEIAENQKVTLSNVKVRILRARKLLGESLEQIKKE